MRKKQRGRQTKRNENYKIRGKTEGVRASKGQNNPNIHRSDKEVEAIEIFPNLMSHP